MANKAPGAVPSYTAAETSSLRIGIIHTRWNTPIVSALLEGSLKSLTASGVPRSNIVVQSVPGSYELPFAVQRMYTASQTSTTGSLVSAATDLLGGSSTTDLTKTENSTSSTAKGPFDAIIAIGVLIKGSTMHFEYISDAVSHGLMRVQLDTGCPVIFGVLTCLSEEQAFTRAGMKSESVRDASRQSHGESGHNHGEDWGNAAMEMAVKRKGWGEGQYKD